MSPTSRRCHYLIRCPAAVVAGLRHRHCCRFSSPSSIQSLVLTSIATIVSSSPRFYCSPLSLPLFSVSSFRYRSAPRLISTWFQDANLHWSSRDKLHRNPTSSRKKQHNRPQKSRIERKGRVPGRGLAIGETTRDRDRLLAGHRYSIPLPGRPGREGDNPTPTLDFYGSEDERADRNGIEH
ncbi:hypothetical protein B296_00011551 [Ensete ventricosum]|uniref:Uncharacterized protein n=1 Tax=Ensete ventricosum TaxID=4639 RepID=A0A426ZPI4_ENSVE|nr:hypothetical protein B296_00011551 [Ensete ventricosum]